MSDSTVLALGFMAGLLFSVLLIQVTRTIRMRRGRRRYMVVLVGSQTGKTFRFNDRRLTFQTEDAATAWCEQMNAGIDWIAMMENRIAVTENRPPDAAPPRFEVRTWPNAGPVA